MHKEAKIYIAGHTGMVGSAIIRCLRSAGFKNLVVRSSEELDLTNQSKAEEFFSKERPNYVFLAAAKVGGIAANNTYRGQFIYENLMIQNNVIHQSYVHGVQKLLFLGSSCVYPKFADQPIKETSLLTGILEPTNEPYAIAKIAGIKLCESYNKQYGTNFISVMPTNLYGPNDNYDIETSHVLPALLRKFHEAKMANANIVKIWGTGTPKREFLHVDDLAKACLFLMNEYSGNMCINIGTGMDISIKELALLIQKIVGFSGEITWDSTKPDGTPRKLLDVSLIENLGWMHAISLKEGMEKVYRNQFLN